MTPDRLAWIDRWLQGQDEEVESPTVEKVPPAEPVVTVPVPAPGLAPRVWPLLACPFCGLPAAAAPLTLSLGIEVVQCRICQAQGPWCRTTEEACLAWQAASRQTGMASSWVPCPSCVQSWIEHRPPQRQAIQVCAFCLCVGGQHILVAPTIELISCAVCHAQGPWGRSAEEAWAAWEVLTTWRRAWGRCHQCHQAYVPTRDTQRYCTARCRYKAARTRHNSLALKAIP